MSIKSQLASGLSIIDAVDALSDWRSLLLAFGGVLIAFLLVMVTGYAAQKSMILAGVLGLIILLWGLTVYNALGLQMMMLAKGRDRLSAIEAIVGGLVIVPKSIALVLIIGILFLLLMLAILLIFFVCKIPGVGPVIYAFAWPFSVVILGTVTIAVFYVGFPLLGPALWEGKSIVDALGTLAAIARDRAVMVIIFFVFLGMLMFLVGGLIGFIIFTGSAESMGLSAIALSENRGYGGGMGGLGGIGGIGGLGASLLGLLSSGTGSGDGGHAVAMMLGSAVLFAISGGATFLVFLRGICLIYLQASAGLDASGEATKLTDVVNTTKAKFNDAAAKVQKSMSEAANKSAEGPTAMPKPRPVTPESTVSLCPKCKEKVGVNDLFCESCGFELK